MLLEIHKSIIDQLKCPHTQNMAIQGLEMIAQARQEGKHIIFAERATLSHIIKSMPTRRASSIFMKIRSEATQTHVLLEKLKYRVQIVSDTYDASQHNDKTTSNIYRMPISYFTDSATIQRTILLCENKKDITIYEMMAKVHAHNIMVEIPIEYEPEGGGGSTTYESYEVHQSSRQRFCLCIVDSDKRAPNGSKGQTARAVLKANNAWPLSKVVVIDARSIENLIPKSTYRDVVDHTPKNLSSLRLLDSLESSAHAEHRRFINMKSGLKMGRLFEQGSQHPERAYWLPIINLLSGHVPQVDSDCIRNDECKEPKTCECIVFSGFGPNVLNQIHKHWHDCQSAVDIADILDRSIKDSWKTIGGLVLSWCCGSSRLSAI